MLAAIPSRIGRLGNKWRASMTTSVRILRRPQVEEKTGLRKSALYAKGDRKSASFDPDFPRPVHLGPNRNSPVGWVEAEVDAWIAAQMAKRPQYGATP